MNKHCLYLTITICWLISLTTGAAQSFLKFYDPPQNFNLEAQSVLLYPNGDYGIGLVRPSNAVALLRTDPTGQELSFTVQVMPENNPHFRELDGSVVTAHRLADSLVLWKRNPAQDTVWRTAVNLAPSTMILQTWNVVENETGEIFVTGYYYTGVNHFSYFTAKFAADGTFLWKNTVTTNDYQFPFGVAPDGLGGGLSGWPVIDTMLPSANPFYNLLTRYLPNGDVAWHHKTYPGLSLSEVGYGVNDAGQSLLVQSENSQFNDTSRLLLLGPAGDTVWYRYLGDEPTMCQLKASLVLPIGNGGFYVLGINYLDNLNQLNATVAKVDIDGTIAWTRTFPNLPLGEISFTAGRVLPDGSLVAAGRRGDNKIVLLRITSDGDLDRYQNKIEGNVRIDENVNCVTDNGETPLQNWIVTVDGPEFSLYAATDAFGHYEIPFIDSGAYKVYLSPLSYVWQPCPDTVTVFFPAGMPPAIDTVDFAVQTPIDCAVLQVDIAAPNFRRCTNLPMSVNICNQGNTAAIPAKLYLLPDPAITLANLSHPYTLQGDTLVLTFDTLSSLECRTVNMTGFIDCNVPLGQTLCMEAFGRSDSICLPPSDMWSGATIVVNGFCDGDSVRLRVTNKGQGPTVQPVDYVIIDDHVITRTNAVHLLAGETKEEVVPATGATWRLEAKQEPGHPLGEQDPTVAVEGCTVTGNFTTGMFNLFANNSGNSSDDIFCNEVIGSYDPNDKTGFPFGVDAAHCIEADQELEYLIRFQNTGTDTAFRVEIRDTLSSWLQPGSIRPGASSHPYSWTLTGTGALSLLFEGIMLPDSNTNEPASNGFVTFRIAQRAGNPVGAIIYNQASIYFDENEPVLTNTPFHTVCKDFLEVNIVSTATPLPGVMRVEISPNPAREILRIRVPERPLKNGELVLRDAFGRECGRQHFDGISVELQRNGVPAGIYFVEILENGSRVGVGKAVWE